jgi:hypothetical protein
VEVILRVSAFGEEFLLKKVDLPLHFANNRDIFEYLRQFEPSRLFYGFLSWIQAWITTQNSRPELVQPNELRVVEVEPQKDLIYLVFVELSS